MRSRRSIRLPGYDYRRRGWYYVTICTQGRVCLFGDVADGAVCLSAAGRIVYSVIQALPRHFPRLTIDAFVVMPNHVHLILALAGEGDDDPADFRNTRRGEASIADGGTHPLAHLPTDRTTPPDNTDASPLPATNVPRGTKPGSVGAIVQNLKSVSTRRIYRLDRSPGRRVWQRNYWERIVRDEAELERIRRYIAENPLMWEEDRLYR